MKWSARLQEANLAQGLLDILRKGTDLTRLATDNRDDLVMSRSLFVREGRKMLGAAGYRPDDHLACEGSLLDRRSRTRLGKIYDTNITQVREYARWLAGQDEGALDAFPAQKLIREVRRDWRDRWRQAGDQFFDGGHIIVFKSDPICCRISPFGTPWPTFDFNSGMGIEEISREEAEAFGLHCSSETPRRADVGFNDALQASLERLEQAVVAAFNRSFNDVNALVEIKYVIVRWNKAPHCLAIEMDVPNDLPNARMIKEAPADIASLQNYTDTSDGVGIPLTPVSNHRGSNAAAGIHWRKHPSTKNPAIAIRPFNTGLSEAGDKLTVAHESGYEIDHRLFGHGDNYGTTTKNHDLKDLMQAIDARDEIKAIRCMW